MKDRKSIVILYSKGLYDTNAMQLANAIEASGDACHVIAIGDDEYTNFCTGKVAKESYKFSIRNARWAYGLFSNMTAKRKAPTKPLKNIKADPVERTGVSKLWYDLTVRYHKIKNILRRFEPEIVLCFTPTVLKSAIKANEKLRMYTTKIYACLTDFGLDMRFFNRRCAGYIVQNDDVRMQLANAGIEANKIFVTNIMASPLVKYDKDEIKAEIGIRNDKPCILLMGGRYGSDNVKSALATLVDYTDNFNIVVMSGGSRTIINVAKHIAIDAYDSVFVIADIDDIGKVYTIADIVVATPTSCICSEALSYHKPLVLLKGVGQVETDNAKYLIANNYAYDASKKDKLMLVISDILLNDGKNYVDLTDNISFGDMNEVAQYLLKRATDIFEEKKILIAEQNLDDATDIDDYEVEEVDADDNIDDFDIDNEYNDLEEN